MASESKLPIFTESLPEIANDVKERIDRAVFELLSAGMWFDVYEMRGGYATEEKSALKIVPLLHEDINRKEDLIFNFRFRVPNNGPLREALDEALANRKESVEKSSQENLAEIDRKITELQALRNTLLNAAPEVAWQETVEDKHPAFNPGE